MTALKYKRAFVAFVLLLASMSLAVQSPVGARDDVQPFCVGVTGTVLEACIGSIYDTVAALIALIGMRMPF